MLPRLGYTISKSSSDSTSESLSLISAKVMALEFEVNVSLGQETDGNFRCRTVDKTMARAVRGSLNIVSYAMNCYQYLDLPEDKGRS